MRSLSPRARNATLVAVGLGLGAMNDWNAITIVELGPQK
jgi:hypothetical protein